MTQKQWEHFAHGSDIGVRGIGGSKEEAFEQAAFALTAVITDPESVVPSELACAPIHSPIGRSYLGAMRAAINCALANRQIITYLVRQAFASILPRVDLPLLYDVSHNTCKVEEHIVNGQPRLLYVHRKGATRAFGPGHPSIPQFFRTAGQPVLIGGTMGTASYVLAGTCEGMALSFGSACHGAGRSMSRHQALRQWQGKQVVEQLGQRGS